LQNIPGPVLADVVSIVQILLAAVSAEELAIIVRVAGIP